MAKVIQVIETEVTRGCGHTESRPCDEERFDSKHRHEPMRTVTQYFDFKGQLLAERDLNDDLVVRVRPRIEVEAIK